ncbi:unnamed protein product [Rotaria sordida]|uniref:Phosphoglucomutase-2 n=1 Tax=Rotaria sordida TaxID=392033 RepID=A0A814JE08_9BILA|nr:unnamed protein product [Rotaria sordida]CAF1341763.1 unnamed protein product [Rotaria sordida]CAF1396012.1 unnamed protein product [Rotaria sordida]CAF1622433.1 unnamed protein product [Rotaria sordida]CAF3860872.1 unnamed protein product [Rotaria sordida]
MSSDKETKKCPSDELLKLVELWLKWDQCETTRKEIEQLKNESKWNDLEVRLLHRIQFGTAGLRAKMGSGFALMNELTVIQATQGLIRHMQSIFKDKSETLSVVIGFDARHQSKRFACLTASLFAHEKIHVYLFDSTTVPTPFIPFSIQKLKCQAGIVITASHNPKDDNGYKLYWENGAQIISPLDTHIARSIENNLEPWKGKAWNLDIIQQNSTLISNPIEKICDLYIKNVSNLCCFPELNANTELKFVYTPVHGVGQVYAEKAFSAFKFQPFISVDEQKRPDPDFPTVKYPNPEEGKETLECAIRVANKTNADFILATDPDADRFALAERDTQGTSQTGWNILSGNQLGALLGWWRWFTWRNKNPRVDVKDVYMLYSTVSSHILKSIGEVEGFNTIDTLTGFKWLGNKSHELINNNKHVIFAFEEAIGFMCDPTNVLDKDGISAMAIGAEMCTYLKSIGRTLYQQLNKISLLYGYHINNNSYVICNKTDVMLKMFHRLRHYDQRKDQQKQEKSEADKHEVKEPEILVQYSNKIKSHLSGDENEKLNSKDEEYVYPKSCGKYNITGIRDLTVGIEADFRGEGKDKKPILPCSSSTQMITFYFDNGSEITIRASGTEPKIKWYSEIRKKLKDTQTSEDNPMIDDESFRQETKQELDQLVQQVVQQFLQPEKNGLIQRETTAK